MYPLRNTKWDDVRHSELVFLQIVENNSMMHPIFADAIDVPLVVALGLAVVIPLLLFEVTVEAFILKQVWLIPFRTLCGFTLIGNCLSLLAGIPVKIINGTLYGFLLPHDLAGFFAWYPAAVTCGTLIYFCVTIAVEGAYAFRWLRRNGRTIAAGMIWKGILLANLTSYAIVAPLNYYFTRPFESSENQFVRDTSWTTHPTVKMFFTDSVNSSLKGVHLDGSGLETIVPAGVRDYLLSADTKFCLFRDTNGNLSLYRMGIPLRTMVLPNHERFLMDSVAFSPSGKYIACVSESHDTLEVMDVKTGQKITRSLLQKLNFRGASVAWSTNETRFYVAGFGNGDRFQFTIQPTGGLLAENLARTNLPDLLICYGRIGYGGWGGSDDWGAVFSHDSCGDMKAYTERGLGSHLGIYQETNRVSELVYLAVNPGLLHIARFDFGDVALLDGCNECLFEANDYIYLLDIRNKRVGILAHGGRFVLLTPRYQKQLNTR